MSDYDLRPGGSLKLKGAVVEGGIVKKKKKKSKRKAERDELVMENVVKQVIQEDKPGSASGSGRNTPTVVGSSDSGPRKTDAERRFEETQKKRLAERVAKLAGKTHKDRVNDFNAKLEALSEHHDIPKVGPG
ncbi:hypothetical protein AGABI1DRAFT_81835 [Agaricus bisporus var. burnettii JB137-S8]|uniref:DUF1754-domain-containing protein n=2 Tax=Agaricus bisporus var. burnettii TaxID=192524 RepID=K5Y7C9_AGABU|nr:uncharacterized protein AGABI1DRAFT_81835 [Agaricus bisporus var. burnettii JB137-S8]EKM84125.1 hypothetical protein AGABI1DRAFT_81835 [Agaricus bisporus var. burnettii JB137-S8]KAF7784082.1 hypothetical protein Agabi119p4_247 [Agaricus bisporus var. burnettii]